MSLLSFSIFYMVNLVMYKSFEMFHFPHDLSSYVWIAWFVPFLHGLSSYVWIAWVVPFLHCLFSYVWIAGVVPFLHGLSSYVWISWLVPFLHDLSSYVWNSRTVPFFTWSILLCMNLLSCSIFYMFYLVMYEFLNFYYFFSKWSIKLWYSSMGAL